MSVLNKLKWTKYKNNTVIKVQLRKSEQHWHEYVWDIKRWKLVWSHLLGMLKYPAYNFINFLKNFYSITSINNIQIFFALISAVCFFKRYYGLFGAAFTREIGRLEEVFDQFR